MRKLVLLLVLFLGSCYGPRGLVRPLTEEENEQVLEAMAAWTESFGEPSPECVVEDLIVVESSTHDEMHYNVGYCGPSDENSNGEWEGDLWCRWGRAAGAYRDDRIYVWAHLSPAKKLRLVRHEAVHWLEDCTDRGFNLWDPHGDTEVWCKQGCPGKFNQRD